jgi:hypothetical protein
LGQTLTEWSLDIPDKKNYRGIRARISFDGENFSIREYPAIHGNKIIFRGTKAPEPGR